MVASSLTAYAPNVPAPALAALIRHESGGNASELTGTARGLLQITDGVRRDYNAAHQGANVTPEELYTPAVNVTVGGWLIDQIVQTYRKAGGALTPDWKSPRWIGLLVLGWNAGWSASHGVPLVVARLEAGGIPADQITAALVQQGAEATPGASPRLREEKRARYAAAVASSTLKGRAVEINTGAGAGAGESGAGGAVLAALGVGAVVAVAAASRKHRGRR